MDYDYSAVEEMAARSFAIGEPRVNPYVALVLAPAPTAARQEHWRQLFEGWERGWSRQAGKDTSD